MSAHWINWPQTRGHSRLHPQAGSGLQAWAGIRDGDHMSTGQSGDEGENAADRAALEQLLGRPLPREWPSLAMPSGARVRVVKEAGWDEPWRSTTPETAVPQGPDLVQIPAVRRRTRRRTAMTAPDRGRGMRLRRLVGPRSVDRHSVRAPSSTETERLRRHGVTFL